MRTAGLAELLAAIDAGTLRRDVEHIANTFPYRLAGTPAAAAMAAYSAARLDAVGAAVSSAHEDIANARVRFENGCVAAITASRISLKTERRMRLFSEEGYLSADFAARKLVMIGRERGLPLPGAGGFRREEVGWQDADSLAAEHAAFVASCLDGAPVVVDAAAGRRALAAALAVTDEIAASRRLAVASGLIQNLQHLAGRSP